VRCTGPSAPRCFDTTTFRAKKKGRFRRPLQNSCGA
jgi:hypothetical protein